MQSERVACPAAAAVAATLALWGTTAAGQGATGPNRRSEATGILAEVRRIVSPEGVERLAAVRIGGIDQWISVRGVDRRNPILLMIHGGPGYTAMPTSSPRWQPCGAR